MPGPQTDDARELVVAAWRAESARLVGALTRMTRDLDLAEDLAQDALVAALEQWPATGVPDNPGAWLMTIAKRRGVDHFRRADRHDRKVSELERAVLAGEPQPVDGAPIRRAAVMRVRVAVALATAPPAGTAVDEGAVSALLADIDALLSEVNTVTLGAPPELQASLESIRNSLVKEAIDLSEVAQRLAGPAEAAADASAPSVPAAARTRVLSVGPEDARERPCGTHRREQMGNPRPVPDERPVR